MEGSESNEDTGNKSMLSDDDKSPSPKIILFEKHEVVKLENVKMKEQQSNIQPDLREKLQTHESSGVIGQRSSSPADLNKKQAEATEIHAEEPEPQLHIQKNSAKDKLPNEENPVKNSQEGNTPSDLVEEQIEAMDIRTEEPGTQEETPKELSVGGPLRNDVTNIFPDFEKDLFEAINNLGDFQMLTISDSSKRFQPVYSQSTESVKKDKICSCSEFYKIQHPHACPFKFSTLGEASLASLSSLKDPLDGDVLDKEYNVETAVNSLDLYKDESEDEQYYQPLHLKGFSKEDYDELFSKLEMPDESSETDDSPTKEPICMKSPSSEVPRPEFPIPTILADLNKKYGDQNQPMLPKLFSTDFLYGKDDDETQREEVLRVRELFKDYPDYDLGSPLEHARIPSPSFSDGLCASLKYGRYVQMTPTDVVSLKLDHLDALSSFRNELRGYSSSIERNEGPLVVRLVRNIARSALETFVKIVEEMKEKVEDDIQFYNKNYIIDNTRIDKFDKS